MPFYLVHAGSALQKITTGGTVSTLTLPTGVTVSTTRRTRFATLGTVIVVVHGPSVNCAIASGTLGMRVLTPATPSSAPTAGVGAAGALTGDYSWKVSYAIMSGATTLSESDLSAASGTVTLAAQRGSLTAIPVSAAADVNARKVYRTLSGGSVYFYVGIINDNTTTTYDSNETDETASLTPVDTDLGAPPGVDTTDYFRLIVAYQNRLWASGNVSKDYLYYSGLNKVYAWPDYLTVGTEGLDIYGITALIPRRTDFAICKSYEMYRLIGDSPTTYEIAPFAESVGCIAPDTVVIMEDMAMWLSAEGVMMWNSAGLINVSDDRVRDWFHGDGIFDRTYFANAFAKFNPAEETYELHLAPTGGTSAITRWVSFDLRTQKWLGPHYTNLFTPTAGATLELGTGQGRRAALLGSSAGHLYQQNDIYLDDGGTAIPVAVTFAPLHGGSPDLEKYWGEPEILVHKNATTDANDVSIYFAPGDLDAAEQAAQTLTLSDGDRHRLERIGTGRWLGARLAYNTSTQNGLHLRGIRIPTHIIGRR